MTSYKPRVYTASKTHYHILWKQMRQDPDWDFVEWTASWPNDPLIDADANGDPIDPDLFAQNWVVNVAEVKDSDFVLVYAKPSDPIRGTLVECGVGLGAGLTVLAVGLDPALHNWLYHPAVRRFGSLREARLHLMRFTTMIPPNRRKKGRPNANQSDV